MKITIAILGFGIIGASCALRLLQAGHKDITVICKDEPLATNSDAAVATWFAPTDAKPHSQALCYQTIPYFRALADIRGSGIYFIPIAYYFKNKAHYLKSSVYQAIKRGLIELAKDDYEPPRNDEFPFVIIANIPLADVPCYRTYLWEQFNSLGGTIVQREINTLNELSGDYDVIINCSGWEARQLSGDERVFPGRGQIEIASIYPTTKQPLSMNIAGLDAYVVFRPGSQDCVFGTTYQINETWRTPTHADTAILKQKLAPFFPQITMLKTRSAVGIRCGRSDVRIDKQIMPSNKLLINCYGHAGSGFSGSWGSADQVLHLINDW